MMKKRKLGIIGGSGLYKMEGFEKTTWKKIKTSWGPPSDEILSAKIGDEEICFIPRHARGHKINPSNINFRANIDALKQSGVTDIISVSAVGSLKENLEPGKFVIVDQFIDRILKAACHEVKIIEDFSDLDANTVSDDIVENTQDTMTLLGKYIEELDTTLNKERLINLQRQLYTEAQDLEL